MDFLEACRKFIEIDSTPANGTLELARYAAEICREAGLYVEIQQETFNGVDQANLIARPVEGRPADEIMLQTHLDTGDPGSYALWTRTGANPFNASIYQDTLYGLGAASTKLDFLCKLKAITELRGANWKRPCVLVGTFGEELGMPGAIKLIRKKKINSKIALIGEPTNLELVHAGKGIAAVEIDIPFSNEELEFRARSDQGDGATTQSRVFIGKAAHSSEPQHGDNAIVKMLEYLGKLPGGLAIMEIEGGISFNTVPAHSVLEIDMVGVLRDAISTKISRIMKSINEVERQFKRYPDSQFNPPEPTLNIGMIRTYEDHIKISGCCRLPPSVSNEVYSQWMETLRQTCHDMGAVFRITDYKQPFRTSLESPLIKSCQDVLGTLGRPTQCGAQSVTNEANVFSRFDIECAVIGPGQGVGNSHAPNEHVRMDQLQDSIHFYKGVLERICL